MKKILIAMFAIGAVWWTAIFLRGVNHNLENYIWNLPLILIPISGGLYNVLRLKKSHINRVAFLWFSVGLIIWGCGTGVFEFYNIFLHVEVPYPSVSDIFYITSYVCFLVGLIRLRISHTQKESQESTRLALGLIVSYAIVIVLYSVIILGGQFRFILSVDTFCLLVYPMFDLLFFVFSARLMYEILYHWHSRKSHLMYLAASLFLLYVTDMSFFLTTQNGAYFVSDWVDGLFLVVFFLMTYAVTSYEE
jgi:hypothetical protein